MLEDLVSDDPEEHVTGDVQTQSEKGQCHEREKYEGCNKERACQLCHIR